MPLDARVTSRKEMCPGLVPEKMVQLVEEEWPQMFLICLSSHQ